MGSIVGSFIQDAALYGKFSMAMFIIAGLAIVLIWKGSK